jgi:hypothetical protein
MQNSLDDIISRMEAIDLEIQNLKSERGNFEIAVRSAIQTEIDDQLLSQDYGCGTATIENGSYKIKAVVSKKIVWDQVQLAGLYDRIKASNEDPADYIKVEFYVPESKYKNWPEVIKSEFIDARTVTPSMAKISFERKE